MARRARGRAVARRLLSPRVHVAGADHRYHRRAAHLGFGAHSPSASAHDRARRRHCARPTALGVVPASFLPPGARTLAAVSPAVSQDARRSHEAGRLNFFGDHAARADTKAFTAFLAPLHKAEWVVYAKRPFGGPEAALSYLARYH